jgi:hypothetical protein
MIRLGFECKISFDLLELRFRQKTKNIQRSWIERQNVMFTKFVYVSDACQIQE